MRGARDDEGTVLVLALAFLAAFGLLAGTLLTLGTTSVRVTAAVRNQVAQTYAEDGALDGAVNVLSANPAAGVHGSDNARCFTLPASAVAGGSSALPANVAVRCLGRTGSATATAAPTGARPSQAVVAGGADAAEGVNLGAGSSDVLGNVAARSRVSVPAGSSLGVSGSLASASCPVAGTLHADVDQCGTSPAAADPGGSDLSWAQPGLGTAASPSSQYPPPVDVLPSCAATVTFSPAAFYSAAALNALFSGCPSATFVFQPGVYLFDFLDRGAATARAWTIASAATTVVGGALATSTTCNPAVSGVELVFAGESQLKVTAGTVNLCAAFTDTTPYDAVTAPAAPATPGQHIAVYGLKSSGTMVDSAARTPKSTSGTGWTFPAGKTGVQALAAADGVEASTTLTTNGATSTLTGPIGTLVPPDATITDASLTATYTESGNGRLDFHAYFAGGSYLFPIGVLPCNGTCAGPTYTWSCGTAAGNSGPCSSYGVTPAAVDPVTVEVVATDNADAPFTATIDSWVVSFTYTEPLSASSGCVATAPYPASGCALLAVTGPAPSTVVNIHGTVYAWLAAIDLSAKLQPGVVVDRGIAARDLQLGLTPAGACQGPLVALAAAGSTPRRVMAEASVGGVLAARAEVCLSDVGGAVNGRVPTVLAWTHF